jgi:DinB superfamily
MNDTFETGEPYTAREILEGLRRLHEDSQRFVAALPASEFVRPQGQKWSPADHVRHLSKSTYPLVRALALPRLLLRILFGRHAGVSRPFPVIREVYREGLRRGATAGRFAPSPRPVPADVEAYRTQVLSSWRQAAASLASQVELWPEPNLDYFRLPHPLLGRLTVREMLFFTLYHNAHHLNLVASRAGTSA